MSASTDIRAYLDMERAAYADLVARSDFSSEAFTQVDTAEAVVGSYAQHEAFDYERWLLSGIDVKPDALALEYGCGPGRMLLRFARHFARLDGVDISPDVLAVARRRCARLERPPRLYATDGDGVPAELNGMYDLAFSVICLQHVCVYTVRRQILETLFRALKPGGVLTFQMGYGPGHAEMVDYFDDFVGAPGTNGVADAGVLHPGDIGVDLEAVGFTSAAYALTPTGPGDTHGAWIFVRALKPGLTSARLSTSPREWAARGFLPLAADQAAATLARDRQLKSGVLARRRELQMQSTALQHAETMAADALAYAHADAAFWRERAAEAKRAIEPLERRVEVDERQIVRLRVADRHRLRALMREVVSIPRQDARRLGIYGAGAHTALLLRETELGSAPGLVLFDSDRSVAGQVIEGHIVHHVSKMAAMNLGVVLISSLAFQEEMAAAVTALRLNDVRIVRCYP
jgi:SAM-dependent methyltransferase